MTASTEARETALLAAQAAVRQDRDETEADR